MLEGIGASLPHHEKVGGRIARPMWVARADADDVLDDRPAGARVAARPYGFLDLLTYRVELLGRHDTVPLAASQIDAHAPVRVGRQRKRFHPRPQRTVTDRHVTVDRRPVLADVVEMSSRLRLVTALQVTQSARGRDQSGQPDARVMPGPSAQPCRSRILPVVDGGVSADAGLDGRIAELPPGGGIGTLEQPLARE